MKILCMGQITYDYSLPIDGFPVEGIKYNFLEKIESSGGGACNASCLLSKWKEEVALSAAIGPDELGTKIKKDLEEYGLQTHSIETVFEAKTPISFILINKNGGNKTSFSINGNEPHVKKHDFDFTPEIIYTDGYEYTASISTINKYQNAITVLDASEYNKNIVDLCKYAKYIIANQNFAERLSGMNIDYANPTTLLEVYKKVAMKFPNSILIITLKEHGAMYLDDNQIKVMPGLKTETIVDSTGAGDIFRAAFVAGLSRGYNIEKNIRISNIAAGLSLQQLSVKKSIPLFSDVASYYETKFGPIEESVNQIGATIETTKDVITNPAPVAQIEEPKIEEVAPVQEVAPQETVAAATAQVFNPFGSTEVVNNDTK